MTTTLDRYPRPWVEYFDSPEASEAERAQAVFALRLTSCPLQRPTDTPPARGARPVSVDLLSALFSESPAPTYALRYLSEPGGAAIGNGEITIALFVKCVARSAQELATRVAQLAGETMTILGAFLPEYLWEPVIDQVEFVALWRPFGAAPVHFASVTRREDLVALESGRPRPSLGRGRGGPVKSASEEALYIVCPFLPRHGPRDSLLRALLLQPAPVLWQASLRPVRLLPPEEEALMEQIDRCEQYQREGNRDAGLGPGTFSEGRAQRAKAVSALMLEQLFRLQDAAYEMQVLLASPSPIPRGLLETAGVDLTLPLGEGVSAGADWAGTPLRGGYDVVLPDSAAGLSAAKGLFERLDHLPWPGSHSPKGLRRWRLLVDAGEAAAAFRFPSAGSEGIPGIDIHATPWRPIPKLLAMAVKDQGEPSLFRVGLNRYLGGHEPVCFPQEDRFQHTYVVGQTGTGKSTLLKSMLLTDIEAGRGVALIDPHGDLFSEVLGSIPESRRDDVVVIDPSDEGWSVGLNMLECQDEEQRHFVVREMRAIMRRLLKDQFGNAAEQYTGPLFYQHVQMNMLLVMSDPSRPGTLLDFYDMYQGPRNWEKWVPLQWNDAQLDRWVSVHLPATDYTRRDRDNLALGDYISSKFEEFVFDPRLRRIFGQRRSTIDLREIMDGSKILLVNLAKGRISESNARFLGMVLMARLQSAAMSRLNTQDSERERFIVYVDEFQALATENFSVLLSEARKFGVGLVLANQYVEQVDRGIVQALLGNVGTLIAFRVGRDDARALAPIFAPLFEGHDLVNLPNWTAAVRTTVGGQVVPSFSLLTEKPRRAPDDAVARDVVDRSRRRYSKPVAIIDSDLSGGSGPAAKSGVIDPL